jgi:uncharacterized protein (DUF1330 family)
VERELVLLVSLYVHPGREADFRRFEAAAARVMARHGGAIERVIRPVAAPGGPPPPHEIHVVTFPRREAFAAYRADPELAGLAALRQAAIARTEVVEGEPGEPYTGAGPATPPARG